MNPSLAIANEFLKRAQRDHAQLTHMQLQKLVYLAHGWCLAVNGTELLEDDIEAWEFGPVIRKLYDALRPYGSRVVNKLICWGDDAPFPPDSGEVASVVLSPEEERVINKVWETYGRFPAFKLSALTHASNSPWSKTYQPNKNRIIDTNVIWDYFADLAAAA